jgi:cytochrome c-type biogenesis protein CcmE
MKSKYVIAGLVGIALIVVAIFSFNKSKIDYSDFSAAKSSTRAVQVIGAWVKEKPAEYNADENLFVFFMKDNLGTESKVVFHGSRPNNFSSATTVVAKGKFHGDEFHATEVLTKCPSKYENQGSAHPDSILPN